MIVQELRKLHPLRVVSGRCHAYFHFSISTTANLDMRGELFTWLERHKNQIGRSRLSPVQFHDVCLTVGCPDISHLALVFLLHCSLIKLNKLNLKIRLPNENYTGFETV